jgi:AP-3 complex subunit mu
MPVQIKPQIMPTKNGGRFDISIQPRSTDGKPIENIVLTIPVPKSTSSVNATCNSGQYMYDPANKVGGCHKRERGELMILNFICYA